MNSKKGQAAIFIIIALALVALIVTLLLINKKPISPGVIENNFQGAIDSCIRSSVEEASDKMIIQGGFIAPQNFRKYEGENVAFLCQNIAYYRPCINQHPIYLSEINDEIYNYALPITRDCIESATTDFRNKGYNVTEGTLTLNTSLSNNLILLSIGKEITIEREGQAQRFDNFDIRIKSPIYDLAKIASEIVNQEAKYCYFEYLGYSILYPRFSIRRFVFSDSTEIYSITDKESKKEMNIAIRGCAIPPGI